MTYYKDRPALTLEGGGLCVTVLPEDGGKLASIYVPALKKELLVRREGSVYKRLTADGSYIDAECAGFDDMFPTCDPYKPEGLPAYPDHGETSRISYRVTAAGRNEITLETDSKLFDLHYVKRLRSGKDGIRIFYSYLNRSDKPFEFLWAGHCMLCGEDGMHVFSSYSGKEPETIMFCTAGRDSALLPRDRLIGYLPGKGAAYKYYPMEPMKEGRFGMRYPQGTLAFTVDPAKIPFLGVWLNNGEFQNLYNIALEPASSPLDAPDRAAAHGFGREILPGESFEFELKLSWENA